MNESSKDNGIEYSTYELSNLLSFSLFSFFNMIEFFSTNFFFPFPVFGKMQLEPSPQLACWLVDCLLSKRVIKISHNN